MKRLAPATVNVGPLLATLSFVFTAYLAVALAAPDVPAPVQEALAALPQLKGNSDETLRCDVSVAHAYDFRQR